MVTTTLDEMLKPLTDRMQVAFAKKILGLRAHEALLTKLDVMRLKGDNGTISSDEHLEYKEIVDAIDVVSVLQIRTLQSSCPNDDRYGDEKHST